METKKLSWREFKKTMIENCNNKTALEGVIVFTKDSFTKNYTEKERSYSVNSKAKYFDTTKLGKSLFGACLDGTESGVRLDYYIFESNWKVEYCYFI